MDDRKVLIIGGGAAGMMAAITLSDIGYQPEIFEKNDKLGKKLFITGKGRCNLMNDCDAETFFGNVISNSKFMYSAFYGFDSEATKKFFADLGLKLKTERGNRVFPVSDHSSDVINALSVRLKRSKVPIHLNTNVTDIKTETTGGEQFVKGIEISGEGGSKRLIEATRVVVATGGLSYPLTGSTGDGIRWASQMGLKIVEPSPALVPMCTEEKWCRDVMGLALKNISVKFYANIKNKLKEVYSDFGEMLFTHFGVSGPVILSASSYVGKYLDNNLIVYIDLKPALSEEQLDDRLLREFSDNINKQFRNAISDLMPKSLLPVVIELSGINPYKKVNEISREERKSFIKLIKNIPLHINRFRGFDEAIITRGGISVKELNPRTMESKQIKGLHFIGEVIDVDALTGGFNLQIAWSTAAALSQLEN